LLPSEVKECGKYWAFKCGYWRRATVIRVPSKNDTGRIAYCAPRIDVGWAVSDSHLLYGVVKSWGKYTPKVSKKAMTEKLGSEFWLR